MAFRPNYGQERAQKRRAKEERKQEKLKKLEEATLQRKAQRAAEGGTQSDGAAPETGAPSDQKAGGQG